MVICYANEGSKSFIKCKSFKYVERCLRDREDGSLVSAACTRTSVTCFESCPGSDYSQEQVFTWSMRNDKLTMF